MRLIECYIESFGKISKQRHSFVGGVNCIRDDNGSGKSTLAAFIKAMLYGMSESRKTNLDENERKHYLPWQGGVCSGSLTFSAKGKTYRVERTFGAKPADDSYALYDTATGKLSADFPEGLGEGLFGIDADGFERTVFLSERALTPKSENKSISAKLSDLVGCDGDIGGMDDAMRVLEDKRKFYNKKGGSGELADRRAEIDSIKRQLEALVETESAADAAFNKMREITTKIEQARAEAKVILARKDEALVRAAEVNHEKQYMEMKASLEYSVNRQREVAEVFGADIPNHEEINDASYKATEAKRLMEDATDSVEIRQFRELSAKFDGKLDKSRVDAAREAIARLREAEAREEMPEVKKAKKLFSGRVPAESEIDSATALLNNKKKKTPAGCIAVYIIGAICTVAGIFITPALIAAGLIAIIITLITEAAIKNKTEAARKKALCDFFSSVCGVNVSDEGEMATRLADMRQLLPYLDDGMSAERSEELWAAINGITALFPEYYSADKLSGAERLIRDYDKYAEMAVAERYMAGDRVTKTARAERLNAEVRAFIARFRTKTAYPFDELRGALNEYLRLKAEIDVKRASLVELESLYSMGEGNQKKAQAEIAELDRQRAENEARVTSLSNEFALTERSYRSYLDALDGRHELIMRKEELEEALRVHQDHYDTILLTKQYITRAKDNMTVKYLGKTKDGFIKYAERISGITGESFEMDTDFGVTKQEGSGTKGIEAYSRGTRDLYNLASRLALVDSLYEKEKPFIILDDPFTALDDKKTAAALKLLREFGKERQIIYFTCSQSRSL